MTIEYKYDEGDLLRQITQYIDGTYDGHYSQNQYQATEFIIDGGHGIGFTVGNILKYAQRYGHKGTPEDWRKDLMKVIHYAIIAMHVHDEKYTVKPPSENNLWVADMSNIKTSNLMINNEILLTSEATTSIVNKPKKSNKKD